ncbi:acyltransferase [Acidiphilium multivorum]|uniref:acyltransferase family protein n=1 Tax=Acidiphilium multivorum TaxID=62140 RepID=UPI001F4C4768|nr:acyltransferase [Acidiphilium multivorum]UNC12811.1 acyltransferase [Acidiphilium multivorum]
MTRPALFSGQTDVSVPMPGLPEIPDGYADIRTRPAKSDRMEGLTGLRALAALWVVGFHYSFGAFAYLYPAGSLRVIRLGYLGVDLFFTLSGFVIWHVHAADFHQPTVPAFRRFIGLRLARLYPVYLFTMLLFVVIVVLGPALGDPSFNPRNYEPGQFLVDLFMLQSWGLTDHLNWNYPAWSVSAEMFCYILFPFLAFGLRKLNNGLVMSAAVALPLALAACYSTIFGHTMNVTLGGPVLLRAAAEFTEGCLLRRIVDMVPVRRIRWTVPILLMIVATEAMFVLQSRLADFMPVLVFPFVILAASSRANAIGRLASSKPFVLVGAASYSLYLMQAPVEKGARFLLAYVAHGTALECAAAVCGYIAILGVSTALVHRYVENPSRRSLRQLVAA